MLLYSFLAVVILCLTHIFTNKLRLTNIPRSKWLSVAGGISVAYIFLAAFPELNEIQHEVSESEIVGWERISEMEVFLLSLVGLTFFYGLENRSKKSWESERAPDEGGKKNLGIFWIHVSSFAVYNAIIGYLLLNREEESLQSFVLYAIAMAFHFIVTDHALEDHFSKSYQARGRWILVAAVFLGWLLSIFISIPEVFIGIIFSFLAGGVIMNVLKEELPKERESNLFAFCVGVVMYGSILILIR
ncbi:hypothetical protein ACXYMT_04845 [Salinimicrobium sp. CAU 1759]